MPEVESHRGPRVDVVALDREGTPILLAELKARAGGMTPDDLVQMAAVCRAAGPSIRYFMFVTLEFITIYQIGVKVPLPSSRISGEQVPGPIASLDSGEVFRQYDPEFGAKPIYDHYLQALVEAWLRDLAYRWHSEEPPGVEVVSGIGLLSMLEGGTTVSEDVARADRLP